MTCIVGLVDKGTVYIGGDSAGVSEYNLTVRADRKVFKNKDFIFGFTSSFRMGQLLRHSFVPPLHDKEVDTEKYMCTTFIDAVRQCLKEGGFAKNEMETESGGQFLVGYQGRLFVIDSDYQVGESANNFNSIGCGQSVALGVMYATACSSANERVTLALKAAEQFSVGVRGPFFVERLEAIK